MTDTMFLFPNKPTPQTTSTPRYRSKLINKLCLSHATALPHGAAIKPPSLQNNEHMVPSPANLTDSKPGAVWALLMPLFEEVFAVDGRREKEGKWRGVNRLWRGTSQYGLDSAVVDDEQANGNE